ncbi:hypothetical protein FHG87_024511 [Trinorchestia longiramus]|nr:hypothetical protein FHG87_024511 [Trinorchestia longiramus]
MFLVFYVQPQWVYDSLNTVTLQPCQSYLPDVALPPHICPFLKNFEGWYVPPEEEDFRKLLDASPEEKETLLKEMARQKQQKLTMLKAANEEKSDDESGSDLDSDEDKYDEDENEKSDDEEKKEGKDNSDVDAKDDEDMEVNDDQEDEENEKEEMKDVVVRGRERFNNKKVEESKEERREIRMRTLMIHKKNKKLYHKMKTKENKRLRRSSMLKDRREAIELHKMGKISDDQLEAPPKTKIKKTFSERRAKLYRDRVRSAVKFAKSPANKNRYKGETKKPAIADTRDDK